MNIYRIRKVSDTSLETRLSYLVVLFLVDLSAFSFRSSLYVSSDILITAEDYSGGHVINL